MVPSGVVLRTTEQELEWHRDAGKRDRVHQPRSRLGRWIPKHAHASAMCMSSLRTDWIGVDRLRPFLDPTTRIKAADQSRACRTRRNRPSDTRL